MADEHAAKYYQGHNDIVDRVTISSDKTVSGDAVVWVIDTDGADVTLSNDIAHRSDFKNQKKLLVVKCAVDASGTNCLVKDEAANTLFTFSGDHSSTPAYAAFRLVSGDRNSVAWELA